MSSSFACGISGNAGLKALIADAPAENQMTAPFDRLIGDWNMEITDIAADGEEKRFTGTWHFYWGLGGRTVLDVWHVPGREQGLNVRFFDTSAGSWNSTWIAPCGRLVMPFIGKMINAELVLEHEDKNGTLSHWIFSEISETSFKWRGEVSIDNGKTWRVEQLMRGERAYN